MQVYKILLQVTGAVQPVSCDEAYLDVTGLGDPQAIASSIRAKIHQETGCTASAGISHNMLLARLATKAGKPNGQYWLLSDQVKSVNHGHDVTCWLLLKHTECDLRDGIFSLYQRREQFFLVLEADVRSCCMKLDCSLNCLQSGQKTRQY